MPLPNAAPAAICFWQAATAVAMAPAICWSATR